MEHAEIHRALREVLQKDRESLNQRFSLRQRAGARINVAALGQHLQTTVNDLVAAVAEVLPERVRAVVNALFDVSLDLFAAGLLGSQTRHPHVSAAWRSVLPRATRLLARDPRRIAGCLSNAVDHLAAQPTSRPAEWIELMAAVSPLCESVPQWLDAGKVAAWRSGLVQYRLAALEIARRLPAKLAARCVGVQGDVTELEWIRRLDRAMHDRWFSPVTAEAMDTTASLRIVQVTGGFRGFGGPCLRPPTVTASDGGLFVGDGEGAWQLLADVFGTMWQRVAKLPRSTTAPAPDIAVDAQGCVTWNGQSQLFHELAEAARFACDGQTLAVTLPTSHHVFLVAPTTTAMV